MRILHDSAYLSESSTELPLPWSKVSVITEAIHTKTCIICSGFKASTKGHVVGREPNTTYYIIINGSQRWIDEYDLLKGE